MSLFRSAPMKYYQLYIPSEDAYNVVSKIAPHGFVQFLDAASNNFHKPYYNSIKRCEEVIYKVDSILRQVRKYNIELPQVPIVQTIFQKQTQVIKTRNITQLAYLEEIQDEIEKSYLSVDDQIKGLQSSQRQIIDLQDYKYLLFKARQIFNSKNDGDSQMQEIDFSKTTLSLLRLVNVSGVISTQLMPKFQKMIFRSTKGHSLLYTFNIPNDVAESVHPNFPVEPRTAFIIIIQSGSNILTKVTRICQSFATKKYVLQTSKEEIFQKIKSIENTINDTKQYCAMISKKLRQDLELAVSLGDYGFSKFQTYRVLIQKQMLIFNTLNMLFTDPYNNGKPSSTVIAQIWIPQQKRGLLFSLMPSVVTIREPVTQQKPPTYFQVNEFTAPFQAIIDTYGIPRYQQINPGLFAIAIFPFLFGVMFGDIGHGGVVLAIAIWMLYDPNAKRMLPDVYNVRYLLLLMGIFAFYSGWIYNQFFSIPLNLFGSCYGHAQPQEEADKLQHCVYPIGFDPKWIRASNELNYFNSYKMKFAVIIGVLQMTLAIFLKLLNTLHFKNYLDTFFEWLPQQIFFFCTFGYMCMLIVAKWAVPWGEERPIGDAPSIIAQMIALPLKLGSTEDKPMWGPEYQQGQESLQYNLLMISLICVPWMLICKPLIIWMRMPDQSKHLPVHQEHSELDENLVHHDDNPNNEDVDPKAKVALPPAKKGNSHDEHDMSEIAVHQIIETIEFVLGTISNTASYLRLWALSLAHGQLARVFLQKTIGGGIESANTIVIALGMYFFFGITVGVIMFMDTMECFLHALRLQWVEFNSKFFKADGRKFEPLELVNTIQGKVLLQRAQQ